MNLVQPLLIQGYEDYEPINCRNGSYTGSTYFEGERYTDRRLRGEPPLEPTREEWLRWQIEVLCGRGKDLMKAIDEELGKVATGKRRHYSSQFIENNRQAAFNLRCELDEIEELVRGYKKELKTILQNGTL